jgi:predicted ATPase/DNA-binding XRE family transcriptional regulator
MSEPETSTFSDLLRHLRERSGLTQEELAERSGLSRDAISALERGRRTRPHPPTLKAIGGALGLSDADVDLLRKATRVQQPVSEPGSCQPEHRNFPTPLTSLIGRTDELNELTAILMRSNVRLVTLSGPGGVGKTRLAIELATGSDGLFPGGTAFVPLGVVWDPTLVLPTIADVLGVRNPGGRALTEQLALILGDQPFLLVLDNLEHLPEAGTTIAALIRACPHLTVLATSRAPLRLSGERDYPVQPLGTISIDSSIQDAVALFVDRAQSVKPDFTLSERNTSAVAEICRRLDGLPLAIELAAARVRVLPPEALLAKLSSGHELLSGGPRDHDIRLQSVRSAIAWSYDLLNRDEQRVFRALSVFIGGFTLQAAEAVLKAALDIEEGEAFAGVASLIDKSLLRQAGDPDGQPEFSMLQTIRGFGLAELEASSDRDPVHRAHADRMVAMAEEAALVFRHRGGDEPWPWFELLERERGNWRAALSWMHERGEVAQLLRMTAAMSWFWYIRGPLQEGRFWLERALAFPRDPSTRTVRGGALVGLGLLAWVAGEGDDALAALEESLTLEYEDRGAWWQASALLLLGIADEAAGRYAEAETRFIEARAAYLAIPHPVNAAISLSHLGVAVWAMGEPDRARLLCEESIVINREHGENWGLGRSLGYLSLIAGEQGDLIGATRALQECLEMRWQATRVRSEHGQQEGADMRWQSAVWDDVGGSLADVGVLLSRLDRPEQAARFFGAADGIRKLVGRPEPHLPERDVYEAVQSGLRQSVGTDVFDHAYASGRSFRADLALDEARALIDEVWLDLATGDLRG